MTILLKVIISALFIAFLTSSISTAEEALNKKVHKPSYQERVSTSSSLAGRDKDENPILREADGSPPKGPPQPPSAPKGLSILKSK